MPSPSEHGPFYWRKVAEGELLVCRECERVTGDPAAACTVQFVSIGHSFFVFCYRCAARERVACRKCGEKDLTV